MRGSIRYTWVSAGAHVIIILALILLSGPRKELDYIESIQVVETQAIAALPVMEALPPPEEKATLQEEVVEVPVPREPEKPAIDPNRRKIIPKPEPPPKPKPVIKPLPKIEPTLADRLKDLEPVQTQANQAPVTDEKKN